MMDTLGYRLDTVCKQYRYKETETEKKKKKETQKKEKDGDRKTRLKTETSRFHCPFVKDKRCLEVSS